MRRYNNGTASQEHTAEHLKKMTALSAKILKLQEEINSLKPGDSQSWKS